MPKWDSGEKVSAGIEAIRGRRFSQQVRFHPHEHELLVRAALLKGETPETFTRWLRDTLIVYAERVIEEHEGN